MEPGDIAVEREADAVEAPQPRARATDAVPRVRTLLVCDLADSTALVERLGDSAAAELLRHHDRLARTLMHRHGGREIDKTDGFLVLFERPVEAVSFALAYQRALRGLSQETGHTLRARIGVHMGEVVLWENTAADIAEGAKQLDVEGLAKPVAARLMALALPGQTLLSGVAFTLAQRAERDVQSESPVRWLTHGRYRFKGVPAPMLVHEAGESGFAPLAPPPSSGKAEREVPLWRRPPILTLEAIALIAAIAVPVALTFRAPPAIAFGERDWVVVGDLRNLTGEAALNDSLETAFRISLEQSRYVNVLPDLKLRDALARMQRPSDTQVDRNIASEIALREGARAVILPTVAEIGGRVRVSAEVIDPNTQTTVYAESADGVGAPSALDSIDVVTRELRSRLGEAMAAIEKDSAPLPKVTSANIEALRAYSVAERAYGEGRLEAARSLYQEALRLDTGFALALTGLARVDYRQDALASAVANAGRALALQDRLTPRDRLYVSAWVATFGAPEDAVEKWKVLTELYPDHLNGVYNLALYQWTLLGQAEPCVENVKRMDLPVYDSRGDAVYLGGACLLGLDRATAALAEFERAVKLGVAQSVTLHAGALASQRRFEEADALLGLGTQSVPPTHVERVLIAAAALVDRGRFDAAVQRFDTLALDGKDAQLLRDNVRAARAITAALDGLQGEEAAQLQASLDEALAALPQDPAHQKRPAAFTALALALTALRAGDAQPAERVLAALETVPAFDGWPTHQALIQVLRAEAASMRGDHDAALQLTAQSSLTLLQQRAARLRVLAAAGRHEDAATLAAKLAGMSGRAYSEWGVRNLLRTLNVAEVAQAPLVEAEMRHALGDAAASAKALRRFEQRWPRATWPAAIAARVAAIDAPR